MEPRRAGCVEICASEVGQTRGCVNQLVNHDCEEWHEIGGLDSNENAAREKAVDSDEKNRSKETGQNTDKVSLDNRT